MVKRWKYVSISECFGIILRSIIAVLLLVVPFSISPFAFSFAKFPIFGDGTLLTTMKDVAVIGFPAVIPVLGDYVDIINLVFDILIYGYLIVLFLNLFNSILLIFTRNNVMRIIFRTVSYICGIYLILSAIVYLAFFVAVYGSFTSNSLTVAALFSECNVLYAFAGFIFCLVLGLRQFDFFKKPFIY